MENMAQALFKRQLRVAIVPFVMFLVCGVVAVVNRDSSEGSAGSGYERDGKYFLSLGHGGFVGTSRERFEFIRHRERIVIACFVGMVVCGLGCVVLIVRAGLPVEMKGQWEIPRVLRLRPGTRTDKQ